MQYYANPFPGVRSPFPAENLIKQSKNAIFCKSVPRRCTLGPAIRPAKRFPTCDPFILAAVVLKTHIATLVGKMSLGL